MIGATAAVALAALGVTLFRSGGSGEYLHVSLAPTRLALGSTGRATLKKTPSGWRIELHARGLPRLANGRFYEAWLRSSAGTLVPLGTFNDGRKVTLWAGVSPTEFPTLIVTRERADGAQTSSGEQVLVGKLTSR